MNIDNATPFTHILMIGCGRMGSALLARWAEAFSDTQFSVIVPTAAKHGDIERFGSNVRCFTSPEQLQSGASFDLVILAIKPQMVHDVLPAYREIIGNAPLLSMMAGTETATLAHMLQGENCIIRIMPNIAAQIGHSVTPYTLNKPISDDLNSRLELFLLSVGTVHRLENEADMHAATAIAGSGPAYLFHYAEAFERAALAAGLPAELAKNMAYETMHSALSLLADEPNATALRERVTSKGGTTQAALDVLMNRETGLAPLMETVVKAAAKRSIELSEMA